MAVYEVFPPPKNIYFKLFFAVFIILAVFSFLFYEKTNAIPATTIFDILILFAVIITRPVLKNKKIALLFLFLFLYVLLSFTYSIVLNGNHILDFLLGYKAFFYLVLLSFFWGKKIGEPRHLTLLFRVLIIFFTLKYAISIFGGLNGRPWLFRENNFELMFLALLFLLKFNLTGNVKFFEWVLVTVIFILSGSKSALPIFIVVSASILFQNITIKKLALGISIVCVLSVAFISVMLKKIAQTGFEGIDRLAFLRVFMSEMNSSSFTEIIFGHARITPLMESSCKSLQFFQGLFSFSNDGSCYSPILHTFILRTIFDHGVVGLIVVIWATHYLLRKSGYSIKVCLIFNLVMLLNSLSVSGYSSGFFALAMVLFLGFAQKRAEILNNKFSIN